MSIRKQLKKILLHISPVFRVVCCIRTQSETLQGYLKLLPELSDIQIINIKNELLSFFWVIFNTARDPISQGARCGSISIDHSLFGLFNVPGTFLDLGGNIGAFSLSFGAMGWNGYTFEASSKNADVLKKSIFLNNFDITLINKAVFDKTGYIYFGQLGPYGLIQNEMTSGIQWEEIPCICLDDWYNQEGAPEKIDFIKIDIEGSEVAALRGMKKMLEKYCFPPIFVESNSWTLFLQSETQKSLLSTANEMGYIPYILKNTSLLKYDINNFPMVLCTDFLLIKDIPENLKINTYGEYIQDPNEVVTFLIKSLSKLEDGFDRQLYTSMCYALKDFPDYVCNIEIRDKLEHIVRINANDNFLKKYLGWFLQ